MKLLERTRPTRTPDLSIRDRDVPLDLLEFTRAMQEYTHQSARMFPTWSEVLEVLLKLGYRKPFHRLAATNRSLLAWPRDGDDRPRPARLVDIGPNRVVLTCSGVPPTGGAARFCLLEPIPTRWAEARVVATEDDGIGPGRVELSVSHGSAWGEILQVIWPECPSSSHDPDGGFPGY